MRRTLTALAVAAITFVAVLVWVQGGAWPAVDATTDAWMWLVG